MKQVGVRETGKHLSKLLKELLIEITYHGKLIATIWPSCDTATWLNHYKNKEIKQRRSFFHKLWDRIGLK